MAENHTQDPNTTDAPSVTIAELQAAGIPVEDVKDLHVMLQRAAQFKKDGDVIANMLADFNAGMQAMNDGVKTLSAEIKAKQESDRFDALGEENLAAAFDGLDPNGAAYKKLRDKFEGEYGKVNTSLHLDTKGAFIKAMQRPIDKNHQDYGAITDMRKAWDNTFLLTAFFGGIESNRKSLVSDEIGLDMPTMMNAVSFLEKGGQPGIEAVKQVVQKANTAYDTQTTDEGVEWVPTVMSANMIEDIYLQLRVAALFPRLAMPSKTWQIPRQTGRGRAYRMSEATAASAIFTNLATSHGGVTDNMSFVAEKLASLQMLSDEIEEDAVVAMLDRVRANTVYSLAASIEDALINGSALTNNLDNAAADNSRLWANTNDQGDGIRLNTGATDVRNAWDGIRRMVPAAGRRDFGGTPTSWLTELRELRTPMGKYGATIDGLAYLTGVEFHIKLLSLPELVTLDKYGANATIFTGEVGKIDGIRVVLSEYQKAFYASTGLYTGTGNTKTLVHLLNTDAAVIADRRAVRVESDRQALAGLRWVLATWRGDFQPLYPSTEVVFAEGYNITV